VLYNEYMNYASGNCIDFSPVTNLAYVLPDYRYIMRMAKMPPSIVEDNEGFDWDELGESLKLEVEMYNNESNDLVVLAKQIREFLQEEVSPVVAQEQNELFKNMVEYLKANNEQAKEKPKTLGETKEEQMGQIHYLFPNLNFDEKKH